MDTDKLLEFGTAVLASGSIQEPLNTLNDAWFNAFGYRVKEKRIRHENELLLLKNSVGNGLKNIPRENIQDPQMSILGPALDASKYYIDEPLLREAIAKIAVGSFDSRLAKNIHPSFIFFIEQLSQIDVVLLRIINGKMNITTTNSKQPVTIKPSSSLPTMDVSFQTNSGTGPTYKQTYFSNVVPQPIIESISSVVGKSVGFEEVSVSFDNLLRLNLITKKGQLVQWFGRSMDSVFQDHIASKIAKNNQQKEIQGIKSTLNTEGSSESDDHTRILHVVVNGDELKTQLTTLNNMTENNSYASFSLTSLGENFCKIIL